MPYIITTTTPDPANAKAYAPDAPAPSPMGAVRGCWPPAVTRRAVATLEDARQAVFAAAEDALGIGRDIATQVEACRAVHETEPVWLPLPDGTVIEVTLVDWADLPPIAEARKRYPHGPARDAVLRDYNATQA